MRNLAITFFLILVCTLAGCCPHKTTVVLVPDEDGTVGRVMIATERDKLLLTQPKTFVQVSHRISSVKEMNEETINRLFGPALERKIPQPLSFLLYFQTDSSIPLSTSLELLPKIVQAIKQWPNPQVRVIGHTDTMGDKAYNDLLSLERAEAVYNLLAAEGISRDIMNVYSHGENDPLVPTAPNVYEPRNRRVEILVR